MKCVHYTFILLLIGTLAVAWFSAMEYLTTNTTTYFWGDIVSSQKYQAQSVATSTQSTSTQIVFTGDVFLGRDVEDGTKQYGYNYPLAMFSNPLFANTNATVINFEAPIPPKHTKTPDLATRFSVASSAVPALQSAGVTHVGLANNHTYDFGDLGLAHTQDVFATAGVQTFGDPNRLATSSITTLATEQGLVAIIAIHALYDMPDLAALQTLLAALPAEVVATVAYIHWGNEYERQASANQKDIAAILEAAGIDLIIGHHPHVVQNISRINKVPVLYSLGNTIFDQYFSAAVQNGLVVTVEFTAADRFIHLHPVSSFGSRTRPYLMPAWERDIFLHELSKRSNPALAEQIKSGTIAW